MNNLGTDQGIQRAPIPKFFHMTEIWDYTNLVTGSDLIPPFPCNPIFSKGSLLEFCIKSWEWVTGKKRVNT